MSRCSVVRLSLVALSLLTPTLSFAQAGEVVAKMGQYELSSEQLRKVAEAQSPVAGSPSLADLDRLARTEIVRQALLAEARAKGWEKRPEAVMQMERAREQALVASYINNLARPETNYPSADEVAAVYETNKAKFAVPRQFRVAQIFFAVARDADKATAARIETQAADIGGKARARPAEFAELARKHSENAESAARGGEMGWIADGQLVPEIRAALDTLPAGGVSKPVKTAQGWHILKLLEGRPATVRPLAEVRDSLVQAMRLNKAEENERAHIEQLLAKAPLTVNEIALAKLQGKTK